MSRPDLEKVAGGAMWKLINYPSLFLSLNNITEATKEEQVYLYDKCICILGGPGGRETFITLDEGMH